MPSEKVLLAFPQEEGEELLSQLVEEAGFSALRASSYFAALEIIQTEELYAVVLISDWAVTQADDSIGLMKYLKGRVLTHSLITKATYQSELDWLDELYERPRHDYQHMPAAIEVIVEFLLRCKSF